VDIVILSEGKPVIIDCDIDLGFKLTPELLEANITSRTKWLFLNSPSNPTGAIYSEQELQALGEVLKKYPHVYIFSDDIYEHISFTGEKFVNIAQVVPELKDRVLVVNGLSKGYAMTGWRLGYGAGPQELIKAMTKIQSQSTSCPSSVTQAAGIEALSGRQDFIPINCENFRKKRDLAVDLLRQIKGLECNIPDGAFYVFPRCEGLFGSTTPVGDKIENSSDLATYFLEYAHVAIVPGISFGMEGYFRFSYATSESLIQEACARIKIACEKLQF
jgi:aspartate aminotransferase